MTDHRDECHDGAFDPVCAECVGGETRTHTRMLDQMRTLLREIRDRLPAAHPVDVPERPADPAPDVDPDEALAIIIDDLVDDHGGTSEWADNEYITRSTALAIARVARECIEAEREEGGYTEPAPADEDPDEALAEAEGRIADLECRAKRAESDLADMTRQRDEWQERAEKAEAAMRDEVAEHDKTRAAVLRLTRERADRAEQTDPTRGEASG